MDDNKTEKVSVGKTLRHITSTLLEKYDQTIKEAANAIEINEKKIKLEELMKFYNEHVKKTLKFLKACRRFPSIEKIDNFCRMFFSYKMGIDGFANRLHEASQMCAYYRTPPFSIDIVIETINNKAHKELKTAIFKELMNCQNLDLRTIYLQNFNCCDKKVQFEFIEKYLYQEPLDTNFEEMSLKKMSQNSKLSLDIPSQLINLHNPIKDNFVTFKDNAFMFSFSNIVLLELFPIFLPKITPEEKENKMSYFCKNIKFNQHYPAFVNNDTSELLKKMGSLNERIRETIIVEIPENKNSKIERMKFDLKLGELQRFLNGFINENVFSFMFLFYQKKIFKFSKKFSVPLAVNCNIPNLILIEYKPNNNILDDDLIDNFKIKITPSYEDEKIKVESSVYLAELSPLVYLNNKIELFSFKDFPYERIISNSLKEFEQIIIGSIYNKVKYIQPYFFLFNFALNEKKIDFFVVERQEQIFQVNNNVPQLFLLFTIVVDSQGNLSILDSDFLFSTKEIEHIKDFLIQIIKGKDFDTLSFNKIIFGKFVRKMFSSTKFSISVNKVEHQTLDHILFEIEIPKYFTSTFKFLFYLDLKIFFKPSGSSEFKVSTFLMKFVEASKEPQFIDFTNNLCKSKLESVLPISVCSFHYLSQKIKALFSENDEFFHNSLEIFNTFTDVNTRIFKVNPEEKRVVTEIGKNDFNLFQNVFQNQGFYGLFQQLVDKIEIPNRNVIFRIYLNRDFLNRFFDTYSNNYSLIESEHIISFNQRDYCLTFYILSKLKYVDLNSTKKILVNFLEKFMVFIEKIKLVTRNNRNFFSERKDFVLSPICVQFKYNLMPTEKRIGILFQVETRQAYFQAELNRRPWKIQLYPGVISSSEFENDKMRLINDLNQETIMINFKHYFLIDEIFDLLVKNFLSYTNLSSKICLTLESLTRKIFAFVKDYNTFEIYCQEKFGFLLEVTSSEIIEIYSYNFYEHFNGLDKTSDLFEAMRRNIRGINLLNEQYPRLIISNPNPRFILDEIKAMIEILKNFN